jgi:CubicO group peptidase (beta-lactamase class C family)
MQPRATLANWRSAPHHKWAFHHVRELIPTAEIRNDPARVRRFQDEPIDLKEDRFIAESDTDGMVVLHRGRKVFEHYANGMDAESPHILMSVSKSMLGLLAGILAERKALELERPVSDYLPEVADTAYRGATVRHLLDMRAGIEWDENYLATSGPILEYRKATGWNPLPPGESPSDLLSFYQRLKSGRAHGGKFDYISPNTDLLGLVIERAAKQPYAELMSELVWKPIGARTSAYITVDRLGAPRTAGGMCVTTEDLARVGQALVEGRVVPQAWVEDLETLGERKAWDAGSFVEYFPGLPMSYRAKWYVLHGASPFIFGVGIHGQNLFVDRKNALVVAKLSSQPAALDATMIGRTLRWVLDLREKLG